MKQAVKIKMEKTLKEIMGQNYKSGSQNSQSNVTTNEEKGTIPFEDSEISVMLEFLEANYEALYGHRTGTEFKANKEKKWKQFVAEVDKVYKYANITQIISTILLSFFNHIVLNLISPMYYSGKYNRTKNQIYTKIDNFKRDSEPV